MFADDTKIYSSLKSENDVMTLQQDLNNLSE